MLWELGAAHGGGQEPDNLGAATHKLKDSKGRDFNERYKEILDHYGLKARTQAINQIKALAVTAPSDFEKHSMVTTAALITRRVYVQVAWTTPKRPRSTHFVRLPAVSVTLVQAGKTTVIVSERQANAALAEQGHRRLKDVIAQELILKS